MTPPPRTFYLIYKLSSAINGRMETLLREFGLTVPQYVYLSQIRGRESLSPARLARINRVSAQSISEMIRIFFERGLIDKRNSSDNKRSFLVFLTPQGHSLVDECDRAIDFLEPIVFAGVNTSDHTTFRNLLETMLANVRRDDSFPALTAEGKKISQDT